MYHGISAQIAQEEIMSQGDTLHDLVDIRDVAAVQMALRGGNGVLGRSGCKRSQS
jgi:hypothetical protein